MSIGAALKGKLMKDMKAKIDAQQARTASPAMPVAAATPRPVANNTPRLLAAMQANQDNAGMPRMARKRMTPRAKIAPTLRMEKGGAVKTTKKTAAKTKPKAKR
jgi:hypothetical protein